MKTLKKKQMKGSPQRGIASKQQAPNGCGLADQGQWSRGAGGGS